MKGLIKMAKLSRKGKIALRAVVAVIIAAALLVAVLAVLARQAVSNYRGAAANQLNSVISGKTTGLTVRLRQVWLGDMLNGSYMAVDGHLYYALTRRLKPKRIVETGCGMSTILCSEALRKNESEGAPECEYTCIEPYPQPYLLTI